MTSPQNLSRNSIPQAPEFYLQVDRFSLLPTEQPLERVIGW